MVQVFHWNRRLFQYKFICITSTITFLIFIHTFEITHHFLKTCPEQEPIDVVYTWVNGSDPRFQNQLDSYLLKFDEKHVDSSARRYTDRNELKFSLRSIEMFAPWVNHVYIVTNGQIPHWLNLDHDRVTLVTHEEIFSEKHNLPTFSSPAIEAHLHRIPGLSKRFIYFNDDVFLRAPVYPDDFHSPSRGFLIYLSWLLPMCAPECLWLYVADGHCDRPCNNPKCQMDGGDCDRSTPLLGDVIVNFEDYDAPDTNYTKLLATMQNTTTSFKVDRTSNISDLISEHNRKILLIDKLKRRRMKKFVYNRDVDAYADSLQHTNRILNELYGFSVRKVPAHAPIMVDRDVMEEMQTKLAKHIGKTARNRVRSVDDVQFSFAYYYFLVHEKIERGVEEIFDQFDTDKSGIWSDIEVRTVVAKLYDLPITDEVFAHFTHMLINCSSRSVLPTLRITKEFVKNCPLLSTHLRLNLGITHKYKFELIKDAEKKHVAFKMLTSNVTQVVQQLDDVRKNVKKFVCLNDNLDQSRTSTNREIERLMLDFYVSLFPVLGKFELSEDYRNRFLYIEDYRELLEKQDRRLKLTCLLFFVIVVVLFLNFFRRRVCEFIDRFFC